MYVQKNSCPTNQNQIFEQSNFDTAQVLIFFFFFCPILPFFFRLISIQDFKSGQLFGLIRARNKFIPRAKSQTNQQNNFETRRSRKNLSCLFYRPILPKQSARTLSTQRILEDALNPSPRGASPINNWKIVLDNVNNSLLNRRIFIAGQC